MADELLPPARPAGSHRASVIAVLSGLLLALGYYVWVAISQHLSHNTFLGDVGIIDDALSATLRGQFMYSQSIGQSHFAVHFTPTLLLALPFYALADHPLTLLIFQSVFLVGACVPIFLLTERLTRSRLLAALMAALYLVNYYVASIHLAAHYEAMFPFCLLMALYGAVTRRWALYGVFLALALGVKTDMAVYIFFLGLYLWLGRGEKRAGWITMAACVVWFALATAAVNAFAGGRADPDYLKFWDVYGATLGQVAAYMALHPWVPFQAILSWRLAVMLATVGFLCLADWRSMLLIIPPAMVILISPAYQMQHLQYYRTATILPFLFFSAILGLRRLQEARWLDGWKLPAAVGVLLAGNAVVWFTTDTLTNDWKMRPYTITDHHRRAIPLLQRTIPSDAVVALNWDLYTQLPRGPRKLSLAEYARAEWIVIDLKGWAGQYDRASLDQIRSYMRANCKIVAIEDGYVIARLREDAPRPLPPIPSTP